MYDLNNIHEYEFLYGNKFATVYRFDNGVKIIGFIHGCLFDLRVLAVGFNPKRQGLGQEALKFLRPKFKKITVNEIYEHALPFWIKMRERGLVDSLGSVKDGGNLYHINETYIPEKPVGKLTIVNSVGIVNIKVNPEFNKVPTMNECGEIPYPDSPPPDPDLEYVCAI